MTELLSIVDINLVKGTRTEEVCKGLFFRAAKTCWFNYEGMGETTRLRLLKKRSCKGCDTCEWLSEEFEQTKDCDDSSFPFIGINDIEHGKIYTIDVDSYRSYEGEYECEIYLKEVKDENNKQ